MVFQIAVLQRRDNVFIGFYTQPEPLNRVMQNVGKDFRVGLIPRIAVESPGFKIGSNGNEGRIFPIGHGRVALNEKRVASVKGDGIVGVLTALSHYHPGMQLFAVKV